MTSNDKRKRLTSAEFTSLFKEISTRPEIYFLLVRLDITFDISLSHLISEGWTLSQIKYYLSPVEMYNNFFHIYEVISWICKIVKLHDATFIEN